MSELSFNKAHTEFQAPKPEAFKVRGHHIDYYNRLSCGVTPHKLARGLRKAFNDSEKIDQQDSQNILYRKDIIGTNHKQARTFEYTAIDFFNEFIQLPDDHPLELIEGKRDSFCKKCPLKGNHCSYKDANSSPFGGAEDTVLADGEYLDKFLDVAKRENIEGITVKKELTKFSDAKPQTTRRIETTVEIFTTILRTWGNEIYSEQE